MSSSYRCSRPRGVAGKPSACPRSVGIQGPKREALNREPLPPGWRRGPCWDPTGSRLLFQNRSSRGGGRGPLPTSYMNNSATTPGLPTTARAWGGRSAPPTPVKAGHLLATCRHPGLTQPPPQPPEMRDRLLGLHPFASSGPRAPLAWRGLSPEASGVCPILLLFQVVVFPAQISTPLPPERKRPLPAEPRGPKIPTPK